MRSLENFEKLTTTTSSNTMNETELDFKSKTFSKNLTESIHKIANEPSLGFYRIEEHVHKSIQNLLNKKSEIDLMNDKLQGIHFDLDYSIDTVVNMYRAKPVFDSINDLITDSLAAAKQINIKNSFSSNQSSSASLSNEANKKQAGTTPKKESIFSGILSTTTKPFRTSSVSITENLNNQESRAPQRSQTMLIPTTNTTTPEVSTNENNKQIKANLNESAINEEETNE